MSVVMAALAVVAAVLVHQERRQGDLETPRQLLHLRVITARQIQPVDLVAAGVDLVLRHQTLRQAQGLQIQLLAHR
jgi:hypothetical protein